MRLDTEQKGRWLARRVLFRLGKAGTEACRADASRRAQAGALRASLDKLFRIGTRAARYGFAAVLTDALGVRRFCSARELAQFYENMEAARRFREREPDARQGRAGTLTGARGSPPNEQEAALRG